MAQLQRLTIAEAQRSENQIQLTAPQQHYLYRVLRLRPGERFIAIDGQGQWWLAALQADSSVAEILETIAVKTELPVSITLLMALPKNGMDDIVRQATEIGVQQIVPILSQRTLLKPSPQKLERWQRIAQEAAEQSERQFVPEILLPIQWADALKTWNANTGQCYLCEARGQHPHLLTCLQSNRASFSPTLTFAIGAEGGWTTQEIDQAITAGYQPVSLGARILRSITAPLVALALIAAMIETAD